MACETGYLSWTREQQVRQARDTPAPLMKRLCYVFTSQHLDHFSTQRELLASWLSHTTSVIFSPAGRSRFRQEGCGCHFPCLIAICSLLSGSQERDQGFLHQFQITVPPECDRYPKIEIDHDFNAAHTFDVAHLCQH